MDLKKIDRLREYISRCEWKWARTMPDCPHEYIYQGRCALSYDEYMDFLHMQVYEGEPAFFGSRKINYLHIDGYKYWTMGTYDRENKTMNRQKLFDCYDNIAETYDTNMSKYADEMAMYSGIIDRCRIRRKNGSIFEIGSGTGNLLDNISIDKSNYQGIEPSRKMIDKFREKHPELSRRVRRKAFEEDGLSFSDYDNTVALFGTASYIMRPYLLRLAERRMSNGLFLMFFKDGWKPDFIDDCSSVPHFRHTEKEIREMFRGCAVKEIGNFIVVTNFKVDLSDTTAFKKKTNQIPLQTSLF